MNITDLKSENGREGAIPMPNGMEFKTEIPKKKINNRKGGVGEEKAHFDLWS